MTVMSGENLNDSSRAAWNANADFWDERMADGNDFQRYLVGPATERLLAIQPGEHILDAACGNGVTARRLAELGAQVTAFDFSAPMIAAATRRGTAKGAIAYHVIDGTDRDAIVSLGRGRFDAAVCNMAIMDMAEIDPLMEGVSGVLKPAGRFVFSMCHPCFNNSGCTRMVEETDQGQVETVHSVKVFRYTTGRPAPGIAMVGQPQPQIYFNRTLSQVMGSCIRAGWRITVVEEPVFPPTDEVSRRSTWKLFAEIPPVLIVRCIRQPAPTAERPGFPQR